MAWGFERNEARRQLVAFAKLAVWLDAGELHVALQRGAAKRHFARFGSPAAQNVGVIGANPDRDSKHRLQLL